MLSLRDTLVLASIINIATAAGLLLLYTSGSLSRRLSLAALPLAAAICLMIVPMPWRKEAFIRGAFRDLNQTLDVGIQLLPLEGLPPDGVLFYRDGLNSTVSVQRMNNVIYLSNNGKVDASTGDAQTQLLLGHLGAVLHSMPRRVLIVAFGSGMTASAVARYPDVEEIDCVEIEPAVIHAAPYLGSLNRGVLSDTRVHVIFDDARNFLLTSRQKYDLIISEPSNPWIAGVATLFTDEFYAAARQRLAPGGIFVQWVQSYSLDPSASDPSSLSAGFRTCTVS